MESFKLVDHKDQKECFCIVLKEIKLREWIATQNTILNPEPKGYQKVKRKITFAITGSFKSWKHGSVCNLILPQFQLNCSNFLHKSISIQCIILGEYKHSPQTTGCISYQVKNMPFVYGTLLEVWKIKLVFRSVVVSCQ